MTGQEEWHLIDHERTACLCDVGQPDYIAATAVGPDGSSHLLLAELAAIGDTSAAYDSHCSTATHEQLGPLPLEFVRRITASRRMHRCGRRTKSGVPCRTPVARVGDACGWHRTEVSR